MVDNVLINHLMYADDLVILQQLLKLCSQHGIHSDIEHIAKKSNIIVVRSKEDRQ